MKTSGMRLPAEARDNIPRYTITVTDESCWLTRHNQKGKPYLTYPVAMDTLSAAFNAFSADTDLLPPDCLFWQNARGRARIGIWLPPQRRELSFSDRKDGAKKITIPLPGFVFVGDGSRYYLYAAKERPAHRNAMLYHAPLPNVNKDGRVCAGTVMFPECSAGTMTQAAVLFFESEFNQDLSDGKISRQGRASLTDFLESSSSARAFPCNRLLSFGWLGDVIRLKEGASYG